MGPKGWNALTNGVRSGRDEADISVRRCFEIDPSLITGNES